LSSGMKVLDIGCGTGMLALELAKNGANVTAIDFSKGMLERFRKDVPKDLENRITILCEDWYEIDIQKKGWYKEFDLVIAFMSPGVASSESFFKMMDCSKKGCAIRGWAGKRTHPVLGALWEKIMDNPLEDKPQSILYKINLLFAMGYYPEITFDTVQWDQKITQKEELDNQMAFFKKVSKKTDNALEKIIKPYLACISEKGIIEREHQGVTATAVWKL
ncbi:MAG: class I SAM-dependent methyltransferase, partial [Desulfobacteraceae bacterium]|nr:class I SAM-dependent methyltransferase [Desulfobacteraceae bacterium]